MKNKDDEDATITLNLSRAGIDKKLANWGKIIIAFLNYVNGNVINKNEVNFGIPKELYSKIVIKNQKNGLKDVSKLLVTDFKESDGAKDLEDIDLFNLISHPLSPNVKGGSRYVDPSALFWDDQTEERWAILFTFGEDTDTGLFYSFASGQQSNETQEKIEGVNLGMYKKA
ncbi:MULTISPECIES: hypothetical protein [unclassified Spiroplasma]|uniref:hypothetical protein n=1 Tax=unclassified Spiroplasma TaxID=2637901 RepID=UPI0030CF7766